MAMNKKTLERAGARLFNIVVSMQNNGYSFHYLTGVEIPRPDDVITLFSENYIIMARSKTGVEKYFTIFGKSP